ncbi:MAG: hypothetical protein BGO96_13805 [Micrococcales bacterium 73-15]|nr:MAG: hypothetical protein BGO96_13805 [Micrococcales bacterium 73-15]
MRRRVVGERLVPGLGGSRTVPQRGVGALGQSPDRDRVAAPAVAQEGAGHVAVGLEHRAASEEPLPRPRAAEVAGVRRAQVAPQRAGQPQPGRGAGRRQRGAALEPVERRGVVAGAEQGVQSRRRQVLEHRSPAQQRELLRRAAGEQDLLGVAGEEPGLVDERADGAAQLGREVGRRAGVEQLERRWPAVRHAGEQVDVLGSERRAMHLAEEPVDLVGTEREIDAADHARDHPAGVGEQAGGHDGHGDDHLDLGRQQAHEPFEVALVVRVVGQAVAVVDRDEPRTGQAGDRVDDGGERELQLVAVRVPAEVPVVVRDDAGGRHAVRTGGIDELPEQRRLPAAGGPDDERDPRVHLGDATQQARSHERPHRGCSVPPRAR